MYKLVLLFTVILSMSFFLNRFNNSKTGKALTIFRGNSELREYYSMINFIYPLSRAYEDIKFRNDYTYYNQQTERFKKAYEGYEQLPDEYHYNKLGWHGYPSFIVGAYLLNDNRLPNESLFGVIKQNLKVNY